MKKTINIKTDRKIYNWPSWDSVYEWEDILKEKLNTSFIYTSNNERYFNKFAEFTNCNILSFFPSNHYELLWEMTVRLKNSSYNRPNLIPCIIDIHISKEQFGDFLTAYKKNPFILISSLEAFNFLIENNFPKKIYHFPLSLADNYMVTSNSQFEKEYDLVLNGRQNPILEEYLKKYSEKHKEFLYVYRVLKKSRNSLDKSFSSFDYYTSKGKCLGNINDRKGYIELIKKSKIGLYSTPGIDGGEIRTKGFNQVTPRFLEFIACGCHIIARYKNNPDTDFYQLNEFCPSINTYDEFEREIDKALKNPVDMKKYSDYLDNHYTSKRIELLKKNT